MDFSNEGVSCVHICELLTSWKFHLYNCYGFASNYYIYPWIWCGVGSVIFIIISAYLIIDRLEGGSFDPSIGDG